MAQEAIYGGYHNLLHTDRLTTRKQHRTKSELGTADRRGKEQGGEGRSREGRGGEGRGD